MPERAVGGYFGLIMAETNLECLTKLERASVNMLDAFTYITGN